MYRVFYSLILIVFAHAGILGQSTSPASTQSCPVITVECPNILDWSQKPVAIYAVVRGGDSSIKPGFTWSISSGKIIAGQGTSTITLGLEGGDAFTATVTIGGFPEKCNDTVSCTFIIEGPPSSRKIDEFGNLTFKDEKARLNKYSIELEVNPGAQGYIIAYPGRHGRETAQARLNRAQNYLTRVHKIEVGRIVTVKGGRRNTPLMELWIVRVGAEPPKPHPEN